MNSTIRLAALVTLTAALAAPAYADCIYPKAPSEPLPNGNTATEQEMVAAMSALNAYNDAVTAYQSCLDLETTKRIAEAGPNATASDLKRIRDLQAQKNDAAYDELQVRVAEFNKQVRAFKAKRKG